MEKKGGKERNDYTGPLQPEIDLSEFSKDFLLQIMRYWGELFEAYESTLVKLSSNLGIDGFGPIEMTDLQIQTMKEIAPPIMQKIAELCKVDINTIEGRIKAGRFIPDNLSDHYVGAHIEILNDKEATMTYDRCYLFESGLVGNNLDILHHVCFNVEPALAEAYMTYPGKPKVVSKMLKVPESTTLTPGEPMCKWHFKIED